LSWLAIAAVFIIQSAWGISRRAYRSIGSALHERHLNARGIAVEIKAVVFDLGNVLVDVRHARAAAALQSSCADGVRLLQETVTSSSLLQRFETGELDRHRFFTEVCEHARVSVPFEAFCFAFCDIFSPVAQMIEAHSALRQRGVPTYAFSNTSELHFEHLKRSYAFLAEFDGYFLSYELGCAKPHVRAYEAVEGRTHLHGGQILYIDDRLENVQAGARRDWQVIHHVSPEPTLERLRALGLL
jgi:putative hydrolase of the HAD superfamily